VEEAAVGQICERVVEGEMLVLCGVAAQIGSLPSQPLGGAGDDPVEGEVEQRESG